MDADAYPSEPGHLLADDKPADFTITCKGRTFGVHREVVCPRSPFFAAALNGKFLEARNNLVNLPDDDPAAIARMITYMYMNEYDEAKDRQLPGEKRDAKHAVDAPCERGKALENLKLAVVDPREDGNAPAKDHSDKATAASPNSAEAERSDENQVDQLAYNNVAVYVVADKYGIKPLKNLALKRFASRLENHALNDALPELIRDTMLLLPPHDDALFEIIVNFLVENTPAMYLNGMHSVLEDYGILAAAVLNGVLKKKAELEKNNKRLAVANRDLKRNNFSLHGDFRDSKAELVNKVNSLTSCRRCRAGFNIDLSEYSWTSTGKIRCARCHTRH